MVDDQRHEDLSTLPSRWASAWGHDPDREVLLLGGEAGGRFTAGALDRLTAAAAGSLRGMGAHRGDRVVWEASSTADGVVAALGVLRAGLVLVPVSERQSDLERSRVIDDVDPAVVISAVPPEVNAPRWTLPSALTSTASPAIRLDEAMPADLALIVYTSGTTGDPKGAMLTHQNLVAQADALTEAWGWTSQDRLLTALPLFHVHGLVVALLTGLATGGSVVVEPTFDAEGFLACAATEGITMTFVVPTMLHRINAFPAAATLADLRLVVSGSAPLSAELSGAFTARGVDILERYGMTETLLTVSNPLDGERRAGTVGQALPGVMLDLPGFREEPRELKVAGPTVFAGYWKKPEATAEVLVDGWMSTGDIVRVDSDGYVIVCGRSKELIITGGFNVYPTEVEDVLAQVEGVAEVCVVGVESDEWGEEVVAHVVMSSGPMALDGLIAAAEVLSPYKRPRRYVQADELPRNALGKLQRHLL